jgi:hypothetical protein
MTDDLTTDPSSNSENIANLVKLFDIKAIYYVDDEILPNAGSLADTIISLSGDFKDKIFLRFSINSGSPNAVVKRSLVEAIESLDPQQKFKLVIDTSENLSSDFSILNIHSTLRILGKIDGIEFNPLPPQEWEEASKELFHNTSDGERILCLFDQDLSKAGGKYANTGRGSGIGLLEEASRNVQNDKFVFCIISSTFAKENEEEQWIGLSKSESISLESTLFFPLSKDRLNIVPDFESGLKNALLNSRCHALKKTSRDVLSIAFQDAIEEFNHIRLNDFVHMIFRTSKEEGAIEADTMFRIQALIQRQKLKARMLSSEPNFSSIINKNVELANNLLLLNPNTTSLPSKSSIDIRTLEFFDELIELNGLFSPTELGDIYERQTGGKKKYILVGQACDLAVRKDGTRSNTNSVILLEIEEKSFESYQALEKKLSKTIFKLQYYNTALGSDKVAYVKFNKQNIIKLSVLDLCALNSSGVSKIDFNSTTECPEQLHSAWRKRYNVLVKEFLDIKTSYEEKSSIINDVQAEIKSLLADALLPQMSFSDFKFATPYYKDGIFDFGLKRIRRLRNPEATKLLNSFTRYMARDADDHDFAREISD